MDTKTTPYIEPTVTELADHMREVLKDYAPAFVDMRILDHALQDRCPQPMGVFGRGYEHWHAALDLIDADPTSGWTLDLYQHHRVGLRFTGFAASHTPID